MPGVAADGRRQLGQGDVSGSYRSHMRSVFMVAGENRTSF